MNETLLTAITGAGGTILAWVLARRKNKADTQLSEIDAVERAVKVWRELGEDMQKKYEAVQQQVEQLRDEVGQLRRENKRLVEENKKLAAQIKAQTNTNGQGS
jgi:peptidoglycan hydrolase CwlO-like protein